MPTIRLHNQTFLGYSHRHVGGQDRRLSDLSGDTQPAGGGASAQTRVRSTRCLVGETPLPLM